MNSPPLASREEDSVDEEDYNLTSKKLRVDDLQSSHSVQILDLKRAGMQRYLVTVEYIGSRYLGFQKQQNQEGRTVQGALEEAFFKFVGKPVKSGASSRTDVGVHALRNVCHVDVERVSKRRPGEILPAHEPEVVRRAVNHFLQTAAQDIQIVNVQCVPPDFHARFEAKERTYHYRIIVCSDALSIFERDRAWHVHEELDLSAMKQACQVLVGHHDFSSFRAAGCQAKSPVRTLDELHICEMPTWPCFPSQMQRHGCLTESPEPGWKTVAWVDESGMKSECAHSRNLRNAKPHCYVVTARARSFLYHQVRLMVGLLKAVGTGVLKICDVQRILEARTVTQTPPMAPACGLYLADVKYDLNNKTEHHD